MATYPHAKPFDIIQTIKDAQGAIKQLQIRTGSLSAIPTLQSDVSILQGETATSWASLSLINSWAGSGTGPNGVMYRWEWVGAWQVHVEGDIINATATGNSTCAVLPSSGGPGDISARPATAQNKPGSWNNAGSAAQNVPWVFINTDGTIQITGIATADKGIFFSFVLPLETL